MQNAECRMQNPERSFRYSAFCILNSAFLLLLCGCSHQVRPYLEEPYPAKLSAWRLFVDRPAELKPNQGVVPYDLNTPLFSDYADKRRTVWMPAGQAAVYHPTESFEFPTGTIFSKTFSYGDRHIETRLLVHASTGWVGLPYVWNQEQTEAFLRVEGDSAQVRLKDASFEYLIPNVNQCKGCHDQSKKTLPIGPKARHLNRDYAYPDGRFNQLAYWTRIGYLKGAPSADAAPRAAVWNDAAAASVEARARAYLDINCAHCHNPAGPGNTSGLDLRSTVSEPVKLGVCKVPVAAGNGSGGLRFGIAPGAPSDSILVYRMESNQPKVMMPEMGRVLAHREGVALIREWISLLKDECGLTEDVAPRRQGAKGYGP